MTGAAGACRRREACAGGAVSVSCGPQRAVRAPAVRKGELGGTPAEQGQQGGGSGAGQRALTRAECAACSPALVRLRTPDHAGRARVLTPRVAKGGGYCGRCIRVWQALLRRKPCF